MGMVALLVLPACFKDKGGNDGDGVADTTTTSADTSTDGTEETDTTASSEATDTSDTTDTTDSNDETETTDANETGEPVPPVSYDECPDGTSAECPTNDPLCVELEGGGTAVAGGGTYSEWHTVCSRACASDADCPTEVMGGTAESKCIDWNGDMICALDCKFGKECPDGYVCEFDICAHPHCSCSGQACDNCPMGN